MKYHKKKLWPISLCSFLLIVHFLYSSCCFKRELGSRSQSVKKRAYLLAGNVCSATKNKVHSILGWQRKRRISVLTASALAFSVICASHSSTSTMGTSSYFPTQQRIEQTVVMPSNTLRVSGGGSTGTNLIKKSNFISKRINERSSHNNDIMRTNSARASALSSIG